MEYRIEQLTDAGYWSIAGSERMAHLAIARCRDYQRKFPGHAWRVRDSEGRLIRAPFQHWTA